MGLRAVGRVPAEDAGPGDPEEPGAETSGVTKAGEGLPGLDEGVGRGLLGVVLVPDSAPDEPVEGDLPTMDKRREGPLGLRSRPRLGNPDEVLVFFAHALPHDFGVAFVASAIDRPSYQVGAGRKALQAVENRSRKTGEDVDSLWIILATSHKAL